MPLLTFPTAKFRFDAQEIDIERRTMSGGTSLSGEEDTIAVDGGGRWVASYEGGPLLEREETLAWRALTGYLEEGATQIIVPFCDPQHQPIDELHSVPHSDDSEFDDDSEYHGGGGEASVAANAALRATTISLNIDLPLPLLGGELFAINHPTKGWRPYRIILIDSQTASSAVVQFRPPLREAVTEGETVDFNEPRCVMVQQGRASTRMELGLYGEAAIRFVEAP